MRASERCSPMDQFVQQNAETPDVKRMVVVLVLNHLRCHVFECAAESIPLLHVVKLDAPAEVANLDDIAIFDEDVLRFNVTMDQTLLMQVIDTAAYLDEKVEGRVFREELSLANQIEQVALTRVLQCEVDRVGVAEARVEPADVLVVQLLLNTDLPDESFFNLAGR